MTTTSQAQASTPSTEDTLHLARWTVQSGSNSQSRGAVVITSGDHQWEATGEGNGPIDALVGALQTDFGIQFEVRDYNQHALTSGQEASAIAYIEAAGPDGSTWWGVGMDSSILDASLQAVVSAANRLLTGPPAADS